eukprot:3025891-Prorocentrum_lima.AAC.1
MTSSLVGSEMCIRDREKSAARVPLRRSGQPRDREEQNALKKTTSPRMPCLLYTSDAADDM